MNGFYVSRDYPEPLRRIRFKDPESGKTLVFLTNSTALPALTIAALYKSRWQVEQSFKELKHDLSIRAIYPKNEDRVEAHIFVALLAYCLQVTLKHQVRRAALEKFKTIQMVDVHLPTSDGRQIILSRYPQPEPEHRMLLNVLRLQLPTQPPPKITTRYRLVEVREPCPA
ncbi:MAG: transposase [Betaproteobacteria bacterium]|nr:transposase [Betaproteobacteria bacterium]